MKFLSPDQYQPTIITRAFDEPMHDELDKGDRPGHPFRGNQYTRGIPGGGVSDYVTLPGRLAQFSESQQRAMIDDFERETGMTIQQAANRALEKLLNAPAEAREHRIWYRRVRDECAAHGKDLGHSMEVVAGVVAATSPQTNWDYSRPKSKPLKSGKAPSSRRPNMDIALGAIKVWNMYTRPGKDGSIPTIKVGKATIKRLKLRSVEGPGEYAITDLSPRDAALLLRKVVGKAAGTNFVTAKNLENAFGLLKTGSIDDNLGGPKVRSFFNAIVSGGATTGITVDTFMARGISGLKKKEADALLYDMGKATPKDPSIIRQVPEGMEYGSRAWEKEFQRMPKRRSGKDAGSSPLGTYPVFEEVLHEVTRQYNARVSEAAESLGAYRGKAMSPSEVQAVLWYVYRWEMDANAPDTQSSRRAATSRLGVMPS